MEKEYEFPRELEKSSNTSIKKPAKKLRFVGKIIIIAFILILAVTGVLAYKIITAPEDGDTTIFTQIRHLITSQDRMVEGEEEDRINFLLLGIGGGGHDGPLLTDTIILASLQPSTKKIAMMSIPRDLLVDIPDYGKSKINHAYAVSEAAEPKTGGRVLAQVLEDVFILPIHYYARIDFAGFEEFIDSIGGVTIDVENTLEDPRYPIPGKENATTSERYEHLVIQEGIRYMNGETALKYVRSRMGYGLEGGDFARSKRQQKVLMAIKEKIISPSTIFSVSKISAAMELLDDHIDTNMELWEMLRLYDITKEISSSDISTIVLDDSPSGVLQANMYGEAFVLTPKTGDWSELRQIAQNIFDPEIVETISLARDPSTVVPTSIKPPEDEVKEISKDVLKNQKEQNRLLIHNGTRIAGLASRTSKYLHSVGYEILSVGNAPIQTYKKSLVYDLKPGELADKKEMLRDLEMLLSAVIFTSGPPADVTTESGESIPYGVNPDADILVILGDEWESRLSTLSQ